VSYPTVQGQAVEGLLYREAQVCLGTRFASSFYLFFLSGTSTPANVYQNGTLTTPFSPTGKVTSDSFGRFPAIYLDPSIIYRVQFFNSASVLQRQSDPYVSQLSTVGTSSLSAFGFQIAPTGEFTIDAPNTGGSGITLTLNASALGTTPLRINGTVPGKSALIVNSAATTGAQTATFAATNKPGTSTSSPAGWLPITCDGVQYYTPIWHGNPFTPYTPAPTGAVIHIFTTPGSFTEAILVGPSGTVQAEVWGSGGGGGSSSGAFVAGTAGGGGLAYSLYAASALGGVGKTFNYTVPAGGVGGTNSAGSNGAAGSITAGTVTGFTAMTGNGGAGGQVHSNGAGGTATGGNASNNTGDGSGTGIGLGGQIANDGSPYGAGGFGTALGGTAATGQNGAVVFYYT
jgi:hypothetical protein